MLLIWRPHLSIFYNYENKNRKIHMNINPQMMSLAREARGLSQAELIAGLKTISQATYSRIEKGIVEIQTDQLKELADRLDYPESFFYRQNNYVTSYQEYLYRKKSTMPKKQQVKLEATFSMIRMLFEDLLMEVEIPDFSLPQIEIEHTNTPEVIANKIRQYLGVPKGPIIDLIGLLENRGIVVYFLEDAPDKFDGTTVITNSGLNIIVLNADMPNYRIKFTIAHELCHIIAHIPFSNENPFKTDIEAEANRFAAELLMPEEQIKPELFGLYYSSLDDIKGYWKVSKSSIIYRAKALGCIDTNRYIYLMTELSRYNERRNERSDVDLDSPKLLTLIVNTFYDELGYTDEEFLKALR
ncbi:MAG: ImmA/IrrE family metallo-endopeptidase, partial [Pedobacter sp.]